MNPWDLSCQTAAKLPLGVLNGEQLALLAAAAQVASLNEMSTGTYSTTATITIGATYGNQIATNCSSNKQHISSELSWLHNKRNKTLDDSVRQQQQQRQQTARINTLVSLEQQIAALAKLNNNISNNLSNDVGADEGSGGSSSSILALLKLDLIDAHRGDASRYYIRF